MSLVGCQDDAAVALDEPAAQVGAPTTPLPAAPPDHPDWSRGAVTVAGYGCLPGVATLSSFRDGFDLAFPDYRLTNKGRSAQKKNCIVSVQIPGTPGWEYALRRARLLGRDSLSLGAKRYYQMSAHTGYKTNTTTGSASSVPNTRFAQSLDAPANWSGCGASASRAVTLLLTLDSTQDASTQIDRLMVDFTWRRCSQ